jgi:hypothetical protein
LLLLQRPRLPPQGLLLEVQLPRLPQQLPPPQALRLQHQQPQQQQLQLQLLGEDPVLQ